MALYYIYKVKTDTYGMSQYAVVEDPEEFAADAFDPAKMDFTGVSIEATDERAAYDAYSKLDASSNIFWCDEPKPIALKREIYEKKIKLATSTLDKIKEQLKAATEYVLKLSSQTLAMRLAITCQSMNTQLIELAKSIQASTKDGSDVSTQEIYDRLKLRYIEQIQRLTYEDK